MNIILTLGLPLVLLLMCFIVGAKSKREYKEKWEEDFSFQYEYDEYSL